jgi:hypothetical protein
VVRSGDNLWNISKQFLGYGDKWGQLYHLNSDVIGANPRLILPGQELNLSDANVVASNSVAPGADAVGTSSPQVSADNHMAEAGAPPQAAVPDAGAAMPATPSSAPMAVSGDASGGAPVLPARDHLLSGPGGAQAAAPATTPTNQTDPSVVSPSLAPDLSFLSKAKR